MKIPDIMSYMKVAFAIPVPFLLYSHEMLWAIGFMLLALLMDADGTVARALHQETEKGGKLDLETDFWMAIMIGIGFLVAGYLTWWWVAAALILLAPMVYVHARGMPTEDGKTIIEKVAGNLTFLLAIPLLVYPQYKTYILALSLIPAAIGSATLTIRSIRKAGK